MGRDVLRADIVKDDSRVAVFREQGSICVTMTVIARLPDCDGQAADAVSAYTPVKLEDAPSIKNRPKHHLKRESERFEHLSNVDYVHTNTHSSQGETQLYIFEDNEAVIKMNIK